MDCWDDGRIEVQNPSTLRVADIQVSIGQFQRETWCDLVSHTRMQCPGKIGLRSGIGPTAAAGGDVQLTEIIDLDFGDTRARANEWRDVTANLNGCWTPVRGSGVAGRGKLRASLPPVSQSK
jgi:hypothetical protein